MEKYEWITLDIYDPNSEQDIWDMSSVFDDDILDKYASLIMQSYFPFIIRKQVEEKGNQYNRYAVAIGFLFLTYEKADDDFLYMNYGLKQEEYGKGFMDQSLFIFNHKLIGNTEEWAQWKKEYERIMSNYLVVNKVKSDDVLLNKLAVKNGNYIMEKAGYNYYQTGLNLKLNDDEMEDAKRIIERDKEEKKLVKKI